MFPKIFEIKLMKNGPAFSSCFAVLYILSSAGRLAGTALLVLSMLVGCEHNEPRPNDPYFAPVTPASLKAPPMANGGLYQEGYSANLWEDKRARRVGDIITVLLEEKTVSSKNAQTDIKKNAEVETNTPTIFGTQPHIPASVLSGASGSDLNLSNTLEGERTFSGKAGSNQSNSLLGSITVTVADVLPNGVLLVKGEKWLTLSTGEEFIRIQGMVRQSDIGPDNSILSTKLADSRITYSGTGDFANSSQMGWLSKFFNSSWWPF
jgi:flagellar L-ring protein FlgH